MATLYIESDGLILNPTPLMDGRYIVLDGELTLLPEDQWPENQIEEGQ